MADREPLPHRSKVVYEVLPVQYLEVDELLLRLIQEHSPHAVLLLGVNCAESEIRLERFALNLDDSKTPDAAGMVRQGQAIREGGPAALQTRVDLIALRERMAARGFAASISNHAGTYLCNHVYYRALDYAAAQKPQMAVLFAHLPMPAVSSDKFDEAAIGNLQRAVRALAELLSFQ